VTELLPAQRTWPLVAAGPAIDRTPLGQVSAVLLDVPRELLHELSQTLSASELERARRFHFESDQARFIAARGALRRLLAAELDVAAELLEFTYGAYGKPDLAPPFDRSGLRFNLAHSENLALIALCRNREIGVDVEAVRALSDELQLVKSCFSAHEQREYQQLDPSRRTAGFFNGWTSTMVFTIGQTLAGPSAGARWMGVQNTAGQIAGILAPIVTGVLVDRTGSFATAFGTAAVLSVIGLGFWTFLTPRVEATRWTTAAPS